MRGRRGYDPSLYAPRYFFLCSFGADVVEDVRDFGILFEFLCRDGDFVLFTGDVEVGNAFMHPFDVAFFVGVVSVSLH